MRSSWKRPLINDFFHEKASSRASSRAIKAISVFRVFFVGRKPELQRFQQLKVKNKTSLVVVRGRRRIGKSRFIEEAAKKDLFFKFAGLAPDEKVTAEDQRKNFAFALIKH